ncbi:GntR family transcriptional regulator [Pseudomonas sp. P5_109]|jgi:DNA-binding GntR family transcriptional regulator|uniref:GntR family transcriptional regulator n=1 Tax=unclassified Pseudomonas TaxID=196821 RepID=UPI001CC1B5EE|nr:MULTISPECIES: GntR family transcriptional regulator [unclassified Pseudomonas]WPN32147.1 GntR family transcriptional regulator [Pseudomonas sp. P5_109]
MSESSLQIPKRGATLRLLVEDKIREAISSGVLRPGQRLVERELCEMTGVGRTSIREALRQLEAEGLITCNPHKGPSVNKISLEETRQLYAVRGLLESFSGQEFALVGTDAQIRRLEEAAAVFEFRAQQYWQYPDRDLDSLRAARDALIEAKTQFYVCLMEGSNNIFIVQMLTTLHNRITLLRATSMTQPGRLQHSVKEIKEIVTAIKSRDGAKAAEACRAHIELSARVAINYLESVEQEDTAMSD